MCRFGTKFIPVQSNNIHLAFCEWSGEEFSEQLPICTAIVAGFVVQMLGVCWSYTGAMQL